MVDVVVDLELAGLALHELCVGGGEEANGLLAQVGGSGLRGPGHQEVSGEDRQGVVPVRVGRAGPTAGVGLVDHVVVIEAPDVDQLDGDPCFDRPAVAVGSELGGEQGQQRPVPLTARREQMLGDLGEVRVFALRDLEQALLEAIHLLPYARERDQASQLGHLPP